MVQQTTPHFLQEKLREQCGISASEPTAPGYLTPKVLSTILIFYNTNTIENISKYFNRFFKVEEIPHETREQPTAVFHRTI